MMLSADIFRISMLYQFCRYEMNNKKISKLKPIEFFEVYPFFQFENILVFGF
jgi:hypothetical protein